jgi:DNA (cytosine-5)-methyltransferase 1
MHTPTAVDVFSGAGGLTEGLKQARFVVLGAIECDPVAVETYRMNHPKTHVFEADIRRLTSRKVLAQIGLRPGELDLLAGCPPCQPFSNLRMRGRRAHSKDESSDLIFDFLRLAEGLSPKAIMLENVPNLASDVRFHRFTTRLVKLGYSVAHRISWMRLSPVTH